MKSLSEGQTNHPKWIALSACVTMGLGVWLQAMAGAGTVALGLQVAGAAVALCLVWAVPKLVAGREWGGAGRWALVGACVALLLVPLIQPGVEGAHRWVMLGPLAIQPLPLVLPLLVWMAARDDVGDPRWSAPGPIGLALVAIALAAQPDQQGVAAALAVSLALLLPWNRPAGVNIARRWVIAGLAFVALVVTAFRPVGLAPVDHVERVIAIALADGPVTGTLAVLGLIGVVILIAAVAWIRGRDLPSGRAGMERTGWLLAVLWAALALGSLSQDYPVPVIGYGLSWVLGWGLTLGLAFAERRKVPSP